MQADEGERVQEEGGGQELTCVASVAAGAPLPWLPFVCGFTKTREVMPWEEDRGPRGTFWHLHVLALSSPPRSTA